MFTPTVSYEDYRRNIKDGFHVPIYFRPLCGSHERLFGGALVWMEGRAPKVFLHDRLQELAPLFGGGVAGLQWMLDRTKADLEHYAGEHGLEALNGWRSQFDNQVELGAVVESFGRCIEDFVEMAFRTHSFMHYMTYFNDKYRVTQDGGTQSPPACVVCNR